MITLISYIISHISSSFLRKVRWVKGLYCRDSKKIIKNVENLKNYGNINVNLADDKTKTVFHRSNSLSMDYFLLPWNIYPLSFNKASIIISISAKAIRRIKLGERIKFQKGEIEIDEKYIKAGLKGQRVYGRPARKRGLKGKRGRGSFKDDNVISIVQRGGRSIEADDVSCYTLSKIAIENINFRSKVYTDEWKGYNNLVYDRGVVNHGRYARGSAHVVRE